MIERELNLPGMSEEELLESMTPEQIVDHIRELGDKASIIEQKMNLASKVLEGAYGYTVEQVLRNEHTTLVVIEGGDTDNAS